VGSARTEDAVNQSKRERTVLLQSVQCNFNDALCKSSAFDIFFFAISPRRPSIASSREERGSLRDIEVPQESVLRWEEGGCEAREPRTDRFLVMEEQPECQRNR
jgi:hypothetical protein